MPLDLPARSSCFIDANIFYYSFVEASALSDACSDLLERAGDGDISAFTSVHVMAEAVHKVMMTELCNRMSVPRAGAVRWAQQNTHRLRELHEFRKFIGDISALQIPMLSIDLHVLRDAGAMSASHGLLTNDAIIIALMLRHGLSNLATNDDDFDRVAGVTVWKPR